MLGVAASIGSVCCLVAVNTLSKAVLNNLSVRVSSAELQCVDTCQQHLLGTRTALLSAAGQHPHRHTARRPRVARVFEHSSRGITTTCYTPIVAFVAEIFALAKPRCV